MEPYPGLMGSEAYKIWEVFFKEKKTHKKCFPLEMYKTSNGKCWILSWGPLGRRSP